jgi:hypothetical protein
MAVIMRRGLGHTGFALGLLFQHELERRPIRPRPPAGTAASMTGSANFAIGARRKLRGKPPRKAVDCNGYPILKQSLWL